VRVVWRLQDNGKPIFFSRNADVPLAFDHLRYYAG
jgi:aldehyde dehydrogenase (NAD+)